ncbi:hypothetical protein BU16DRAFT_343636 [Lophium mytilinum]|uniref:Uncharacterized protein n=1 Tax=Lophium mytilinum TaxID=390894 RepID=A0A6A6QZ48_9PEZI|nr:hypothetical protein BU16DRAFT_343636 [Lophium mytilinum]
MSAVVDCAVPPQTKAWPFTAVPHQDYTVFPPSPPLEMSETVPLYMSDSAMPAQASNMTSSLPSSGWYGPSVPAPDCSNEVRTMVPPPLLFLSG